MKLTTIILVFLLSGSIAYAQMPHLKSFGHGRKMMNEEVSMDTIIGEIMFQDGRDDTISVVRFDNVYLGLQPLIISRKLAVPTDSLGLLSFDLQGDPFENILWRVDNTAAKFQSRNFDRVLLRVTYRYHGHIKQYYVTNVKIATAYLLIIEKELTNSGASSALETFHKFVSSTRLIKGVRGKVVWLEAP